MDATDVQNKTEEKMKADKEVLKVKEDLKNSVISADWTGVMDIYEKHDKKAEILCMRVNPSLETALHMAIRAHERNVEFVKNMIRHLDHDEVDLEDYRGNTPLHLAAQMGNERMCAMIADKLPQLIHVRNKQTETPLFVAAQHGKIPAFLSLCQNPEIHENIYTYGRRNSDGKTVLHSAIDEENFDTKCEEPKVIQDPTDEQLQINVQNPAEPMDNPPSNNCFAKRFIQHLLKIKDNRLKYGDATTWCSFLKHLKELKTKHLWSMLIMKKLLHYASYNTYEENAGGSQLNNDYDNVPYSPSDVENKEDHNRDLCPASETPKPLGATNETPTLIAAKNGITEMIRHILGTFPMAIYERNSEEKNVILIAIENRQPMVFKRLLERKDFPKDLLLQWDIAGNNALHLAAMNRKSKVSPNVVLQMQWEIKWYEYIKERVPKQLQRHQNVEWKIPDEIFIEEHERLVKSDSDWLMKTSEACTIVATLIATVAFATSSSVPGGINGSNGEPVLKQQRMFDVFAISSLVALCFSLTAVVVFLGILTSRHMTMDFRNDLPRKILLGLTALFISISSMLVSFCGGHFFLLKSVLKRAQIAEYMVILLPVTIFIIAQFPLYFKLCLARIKKVPERVFLDVRT